MRLFGLIGFPLSHSFSGSYFAAKFKNEGITDARYELYPISNIGLLPELIEKNPDLAGLNVTIPYKESVLPYLNETENDISDIGAVNTIRIFRNIKHIVLKGYNTDVYGFGESLRTLLKSFETGNALVLGTGGASRAVSHVLKNYGFNVIFVSRKPSKPGYISYNSITERMIRDSRIIVNTSPVGMYPHTGEAPEIPYHYLSDRQILYDLVYNPEQTLFLQKGSEYGAITKNGLQMLYLQAEKSWAIWNDL